MAKIKPTSFSARIEIIGINPFVYVPQNVLNSIFSDAKKDKGPIPVRGVINGKAFTQTLVRYSGEWRLYINTLMLKDSPRKIGEIIQLSLEYDNEERIIQTHPAFIQALNKNKLAKKNFDSLSPSLQKEIVRYISRLKTEVAIAKNIEKTIGFLLGKNKFIGREKSKPY